MTIVKFKSQETELIFLGQISLRYPENIQIDALRKLRIIDAARSIIDLEVLPGNCLEKLAEELGEYSLRINDSRWQICFIWTNQNNATDVEIVGDFEMTKRKRLPNIHPGEVLKLDFLAPMQITVDRLSVDIGVAQTQMSEILTGTRDINADIALKLADYFGNSAQFWMNLQTQYDSEDESSHRSSIDILDRIISRDSDRDDDRGLRHNRYGYFNDRDSLDTNRQARLDERSPSHRYDDIDRSFGGRRERSKQGRRLSDFQTIEVDGKLVISVEDLIAAGVIFLE